MALAEGAEGGFAGVYPILKEMEERGQVRRGYFVAGLGAAQFALPGAVDRLRDERRVGIGTGNETDDGLGELGETLVLAASDPAQPYGAALSWPESEGRPSRSVGAYVVLADGAPLAYLERGGRSLTIFSGGETDHRWVAELANLVRSGRSGALEITKINGKPPAEVPEARDLLLGGGFKPGYRGPTLRR